MDQSLLILGAPGSGKTTLLLELARDLLTRATHDPTHPIPVVFPLSTWAAIAETLGGMAPGRTQPPLLRPQEDRPGMGCVGPGSAPARRAR